MSIHSLIYFLDTLYVYVAMWNGNSQFPSGSTKFSEDLKRKMLSKSVSLISYTCSLLADSHSEIFSKHEQAQMHCCLTCLKFIREFVFQIEYTHFWNSSLQVFLLHLQEDDINVDCHEIWYEHPKTGGHPPLYFIISQAAM